MELRMRQKENNSTNKWAHELSFFPSFPLPSEDKPPVCIMVINPPKSDNTSWVDLIEEMPSGTK
jgi:hypothetical protein